MSRWALLPEPDARMARRTMLRRCGIAHQYHAGPAINRARFGLKPAGQGLRNDPGTPVWTKGKCLSFAPSSQKRTDMSDIKSRVIAIIVDKLGVDQSEVTPEASFTNDLGADSLDTVELIMEFEKEFNIAIPDDQAEKIQTVGQAVDYVEKNAK